MLLFFSVLEKKVFDSQPAPLTNFRFVRKSVFTFLGTGNMSVVFKFCNIASMFLLIYEKSDARITLFLTNLCINTELNKFKHSDEPQQFSNALVSQLLLHSIWLKV